MLDRCVDPTASRRRIFWTTQPSSCGGFQSCEATCGIPGLQFQLPSDCKTCSCSCPGQDLAHSPECIAENRAANTPVTFATNDWVRGLLLNILNTYARDASTECGVLPGSQGGHWSESYMDGSGAGYIGSNIYSNLIKRAASIKDAVALLRAGLAKDVQKLVQLGVARSVEVEVVYLGKNRVKADITFSGPASADGRVNLSGERIENGWVWA